MARLPRLVAPGQAHHIIQRGNNRQAIFADERDYGVFLERLAEASARFGLAIHAYVLMTNHVHILATPQAAASMGRVMQSVGRRYVRYFNHVYGRTGTLWEGRYRATPIAAEDYLLACSRYIELNPVRAGMVVSPAHYRWSRYRCNAQGEVAYFTPWRPLLWRSEPSEWKPPFTGREGYLAGGETSCLRVEGFQGRA